MRKLLLATSALAGVAMIATGVQAAAPAEDPLAVTVGGYVDFRAANFGFDNVDLTASNSADLGAADATTNSRRHYDFETEWKINVDVVGKAGSVEYGGRIGLTNEADYTDTYQGGRDDVSMAEAYVYLANNYGKLVLGDFHGPSDAFVYAPSVGAGQTDGAYTDFLEPDVIWNPTKYGMDDEEKDTKIAYMTPQLGTDSHKFQAAVSYAPNYNDQGQNVIKRNGANNTSTPVGALQSGSALAPYRDTWEAALNYTGSFDPVGVAIGFFMANGDGNESFNIGPDYTGTPTTTPRDYTTYAVGGQVMYAGFTLGGSWSDFGSFMTYNGQDRDQTVTTAGLTYEWDKLGVGFNWRGGEGYNNGFLNPSTPTGLLRDRAYVDSFNSYGFGATYAWFPGMSTNFDAVFFDQSRDDLANGGAVTYYDIEGQVIMLTQKLEF